MKASIKESFHHTYFIAIKLSVFKTNFPILNNLPTIKSSANTTKPHNSNSIKAKWFKLHTPVIFITRDVYEVEEAVAF